MTILYEEKILNGDNTGPKAFAISQQCINKWAGFYTNTPAGTAANDDITFLRLTSQGVAQGTSRSSQTISFLS